MKQQNDPLAELRELYAKLSRRHQEARGPRPVSDTDQQPVPPTQQCDNGKLLRWLSVDPEIKIGGRELEIIRAACVHSDKLKKYLAECKK